MIVEGSRDEGAMRDGAGMNGCSRAPVDGASRRALRFPLGARMIGKSGSEVRRMR